MRFPCARKGCDKQVHDRTVSVEVRDLWRCGDHDERVLTSALIVCSFDCLIAVASDLHESDVAAAKDEEPW